MVANEASDVFICNVWKFKAYRIMRSAQSDYAGILQVFKVFDLG